MLVITRRPNQAIIITQHSDQIITARDDRDEIEIIVLGVSGRQVRLGIRAPKKTAIYREELLDIGRHNSFHLKETWQKDEIEAI